MKLWIFLISIFFPPLSFFLSFHRERPLGIESVRWNPNPGHRLWLVYGGVSGVLEVFSVASK